MDLLIDFVSQHLVDDTTRLILDRNTWPDIDIELAVNCIESRRKLKGKVKEWYENPGLIFPAKLSAEQCSSSSTGHYKASLAASIISSSDSASKIADLTGGLGVDSWFFSKVADKVLYNEMQPVLCNAASHNFKTLNASNIHISNMEINPETADKIIDGFLPGLIYMDPARRGEGGKKVFLIEECTPDVLTLKDILFRHCRHILIKLSPMADITMVCNRLGACCREVHVVATGGECKELLIWVDREWEGEYTIKAVELLADYPNSDASLFSFTVTDEKNCQTVIADEISSSAFLFEPGKALMKSGGYNLIGREFSINKIGHSTHYFLTEESEKIQELMKFGKVFRIIRQGSLDKRTIKEFSKEFPKAEVTARNIPIDSETLRKKLSVSSDDHLHIFGLKADKIGNILICAERVFNAPGDLQES